VSIPVRVSIPVLGSIPAPRSRTGAQRREPADVVGLIGDPVASDATAPQALVDDHVALGRLVVKRDRCHGTTARACAVAGPDVDVQRVQAGGAVVAVAAAGERRDVHAAMRADKGRVLGVPADGRSSRVEVIFKLERPRVPCVPARRGRFRAACARRLGWRVTDSPPAFRASDYFQFLLHPGLFIRESVPLLVLSRRQR
jgi:hypothetical protein